MKTLGFLVNPVSGMGGSVGLKGTDGEDVLKLAVERGARPVAEERALRALEFLRRKETAFQVLTCAGPMGENALVRAGFSRERFRIVHSPAGERTTSKDTREACTRFVAERIDLLLFCGGDGTARDILEVVGQNVPMLGIPAGVKMHSAVFGSSPAAAGEGALEFLEGGLELRKSEVLDTDEDEYRAGRLRTRLAGYALTPYRRALVQIGKAVIEGEDEEEAKEAIADHMEELMKGSDALFILGPGTTVEAIARRMGLEKTLLGVDAVRDGRLVARDAGEKGLLELLRDAWEARLVVSPIGAQGFVFGRGNQQLSPEVIKKVGIGNVIVVATPQKLSQTEVLMVDTGDEALDRAFAGYIRVITGYRRTQMRTLEIFSS